MHVYGLDELFAKIPELRQPKIALLAAVIAILSSCTATAILELLDKFWPAWTLVSQIAFVILAYFIIAPFFQRRSVYKRRWGKDAYRNAFACHVLTGLPVIFAVIVHVAFMPGERIITGNWVLYAEVLAWYLCLSGSILDVCAVFTFGFDNLGMLYVYYPQEGRMVNSKIYAIMRHPVYSALIRIGMALALWRGTLASLGFGIFLPFGMFAWLRLVEERELIERFGENYVAYRQQTPAFFSRLKNSVEFWKFLAAGTAKKT